MEGHSIVSAKKRILPKYGLALSLPMATRNSTSRIFGQGLTFDDVLLMPAYSEVLPSEVNIHAQLTKHIKLHVPVLSAAMDTVTEAQLAIALAREGGIGILHKNMSIERQAEQVRKVKRSESGMIIDPITLEVTATIGDALNLMRDNKIGGIPIVDKNHKLVGILTNRDLRFETDRKRKISEVMTKENLIIAPEGTDLKKAEKILRQYKIEKLPVVSKQGKLIGLITYRDILQLSAFPNAVKDKIGRLLVGAALGITKDLLDRAAALQAVGVDIVSLDSAHGHSKGVIEALKTLKKNFKNLPVIAGNVATAQGALALANAGADAVKVGIGPGSICTTRIVAGAGVPQLTAIMEAAKALKGKNIPVIADGGIRYTGDMVKALAAGANCVMMGSIFAGTEESPGETIIYEGRKFKGYRGMGSIGAMGQGSGDRYFQEGTDSKKFVPEGIEGRVAYKGNLNEIIYQFVGGLKAGMGYCGAKTVKDLQNATFVQITNAGMKESHAHDIDITKEAPNYSRK
jgi:IMP dehydrogenase